MDLNLIHSAHVMDANLVGMERGPPDGTEVHSTKGNPRGVSRCHSFEWEVGRVMSAVRAS